MDRLGGFGGALARARELGDLSTDVPIVVVPQRPETLLDYVFGVGTFSAQGGVGAGDEGLTSEAPAVLSPELAELAGLAVLVSRSDDLPVARLDQAVLGAP